MASPLLRKANNPPRDAVPLEGATWHILVPASLPTGTRANKRRKHWVDIRCV
jgi:hypothetical protein